MAPIPVVDAVDISTLRLFLAVVDLGSVSKAAARHGLSQPSATAKLHKLERQLGVQLLDRGPSGSVATPAGEHLAPACADVVAATVALVDRAGDRKEAQTRLAVTTTRHVAEHHLPAWIAGAGLAGVELDVTEGDTMTVAQTVRSAEAAIGFTEGPAAPLGLRSAVVAREVVVPVVGPSHAWFSRRRPVAGRDLAAATLVLGRRGSGTRDVVETALAAHGLEGGGQRVEVDGAAAAHVVAVNGAGVAFLPRCRVDHAVHAGLLRVVSVRDVRIEQPVRVVWRGTRPAEAPARRLLDHVR